MATFFDKMLRFNYSKDLHEHLKGLDISCSDFTASSTYSFITIIVVILIPIVMLNYYYGIFNRPKLSSFLTWLLNILLCGTIVFIVSMVRTTGDLNSKNYCQDLHFSTVDCMLFGFTAATYAVILSILISLIIKWWSLNNKKIPF
jgi:hypothetical protein